MTMYAAAAVALPVVFSGIVGVGELVLVLDGTGGCMSGTSDSWRKV